jgi:hypothetical protein
MLFLSGGLTPYSYLKSYFTQTMDLNFAYHIMLCAFCCKAAIVLIEQNIQSKLLSLNYSSDMRRLVSVNPFTLVAALKVPAL